jgi:hypothetical protein
VGFSEVVKGSCAAGDVGQLGHQKAINDEFMTYILRTGRIRG